MIGQNKILTLFSLFHCFLIRSIPSATAFQSPTVSSERHPMFLGVVDWQVRMELIVVLDKVWSLQTSCQQQYGYCNLYLATSQSPDSLG